MFITTFKTAHHLSLSSAIPIQSMPPPLHLFKMYFNIIFPFMPWSSEWPFSFRFPHLKPVCLSLLPCNCHMSHPTYLPWFNHLSNVVTSTKHEAHYAVFSILLLPCPSWAQISYLPQHLVVKHRQCEDHVSHTYKTTGKIIHLYILIFVFLDSILEERIFCTEW